MTDPHYNRRRQLYSLLGDLPLRDRPIQCRVVDEQRRGAYVQQTLSLDVNGIEEVPAYFLTPIKGTPPYPTVVYHHSHGGRYAVGKDELIHGADYINRPCWGQQLVTEGYAVFCADTWCFGERSGRAESVTFKQMLWQGQVLWGMMVYDSLRATDYLLSRDDVDKSRIAAMGMSMGSTMAWWHAALDPRITSCIDICCLTDYQALIDTNGLDYHGLYYYVPNLLKCFTTAQINAMIAPRPHLSTAGIYDKLTPVAGLDRIEEELKATYEKLEAPENFQLRRYNTGHRETHEMRADILAFIKQHL